MLARLERFDPPFNMHRMGQRNIDRINHRICQERVIAVMHVQVRGDPSKGRGLVDIARGNSRQTPTPRQMQRRCHLV